MRCVTSGSDSDSVASRNEEVEPVDHSCLFFIMRTQNGNFWIFRRLASDGLVGS